MVAESVVPTSMRFILTTPQIPTILNARDFGKRARMPANESARAVILANQSPRAVIPTNQGALPFFCEAPARRTSRVIRAAGCRSWECCKPGRKKQKVLDVQVVRLCVRTRCSTVPRTRRPPHPFSALPSLFSVSSKIAADFIVVS